MARDLRSYLRELVEHGSSNLKVVDEEVNPRFGITAHAAHFAKSGEYPGFLFTNVKGADYPCVSNLLTTYDRIALMLGCAVEDIPRVYGERLNNPVPPRRVEAAQAPVKHTVIAAGDIDLGRLPIPVHNELDGGPYLSAAVMMIRDPDSGVINAGIYRHQICGKNEMTVWFLGAHHGGAIYRKYKNTGKTAPIAIAIGHHPGFLMGAISRVTGLGGEFEAAGALLGEPLDVVKAQSSDLLVPARAEFILEGEILLDSEYPEGPFGEWPGHYLGHTMAPIIRIHTITARRHAIFQDIVASGQEHLMIGSIPRSGSIYHSVKAVVPSLKAVNVPYYSRMHCYVSLHKERDSDVKKAAFTALNTEQENLRAVVVVDEDIDVFDGNQVAWAIGTRFDASEDLLVIPHWNGPGGLLPTNWTYHEDGTHTPKMSSAVIIDATKPAPPIPFPERAVVPGADVDFVNYKGARQFSVSDDHWLSNENDL